MDDFNGDNAKLVECINALLSMDAAGSLRPHGVGGHGRKLLQAAASRLGALSHAAGQDGEQCRAASVEDGEAGRLADKLDELCTYPNGHSISDAGEPWGATCETLRTAAKLLRALSRGVPEGK